MKKGIVRVPETVNKKDAESACGLRDYEGREVEYTSKAGRDFYIVNLYPGSIKEQYIVPVEWIEPIKEPIQWNRVRVDAPLEICSQVKYGEKWEPFHFSHQSKYGQLWVFESGKTSHTATTKYLFEAHPTNARFPEGVNPEDWYKDE